MIFNNMKYDHLSLQTGEEVKYENNDDDGVNLTSLNMFWCKEQIHQNPWYHDCIIMVSDLFHPVKYNIKDLASLC